MMALSYSFYEDKIAGGVGLWRGGRLSFGPDSSFLPASIPSSREECISKLSALLGQ